MQPNFEAMTNKELIAYYIAHREDTEPLRELYRRRTPDEEATWYGPFVTADGTPIQDNIRIAEEAIKQRIEQINKKN
jgi:hypothetical protein